MADRETMRAEMAAMMAADEVLDGWAVPDERTPARPDPPGCFNCGTADDLHWQRLDLDLPAIPGCLDCLTALVLGQDDLLRALRPPGRRRPLPDR